MNSPLIPMDTNSWDIAKIDSLLNLTNIERETFDFKGAEFKKLYEHLCAFANNPESGIIVLGVDPVKSKDEVIIRYKKAGFDTDKGDWILNQIDNQMANVNPIPKVTHNILRDTDDRLYPVLGVEGEEVHKPYFVKVEGRQCMVRIGSSSMPASRTTVLYLFSNIIAKRNNVERLHSSAGFLREALKHTCERIRDIDHNDIDEKLLLLDTSYFSSAALSAYRFLEENGLLGGHDKIDSFTGGFYSFMQDIQRLNSFMDWYNQGNNAHRKHMMMKKLQFWEPRGNDYKNAVGFLDKIISKCDDFLSKV
jgi:hypothetical protein